ncbi:AraC family transcriptional regulator [Erythrobacter litoralis]|uniref:helix-turn-helix domain-containing protein n=1 Tax=Erythrobacter litoralis TaxID=39960 RepID=UPI002435EF01|nr:helix-turn-helix domain-containing protein [Erythrobacter litoralis]MDG6080019.1 AraC family transcriptional regulator [Erythrobacter litoralis]
MPRATPTADFLPDVRVFVAPDDLMPCFSLIYRCEVDLPEGEEIADYLLPEWANIRFSTQNYPIVTLSGTGQDITGPFVATGPTARPLRFRLKRTTIWGIGFLPLGWARFIDLPANDFADTIQVGETSDAFARFAPLADILCDPDGDPDTQFDGMIAFFRDLAGPPRDATRIANILQAMFDPYLTQVTDFADNAGMTKRTLERVCLKHFGFSPQLLLRRQRLMRSLASFMLEEKAVWSRRIDKHYHDQAHFVREFHTFMGMKPTEYAQMPHPMLSAFMVERNRVWGPAIPSFEPPTATPGASPIIPAKT